jgi:hypothetical protein
MIYHSRGGITRRENGLMLCHNCHLRLHDGFIPLRLVFAFKQDLLRGGSDSPVAAELCTDGLLDEVRRIRESPLTPSAQFTLLNDILIDANSLRSIPGRNMVFVHVLLAKASVLNDSTPPIRATLESTLASMDNRRAWAAALASKAAKYARMLGDAWLCARGLHVIAVCYNARNRFGSAVAAHRRVLGYVGEAHWGKVLRERTEMFRGRVLREMGVCRAKQTARSTAARGNVLASLEVARAIGARGDIDDALVRCCEAATFLGDLKKARAYLDELYGVWSRMNANHKAITVKLDARLAMAAGASSVAEERIEQGRQWCASNGIHHQAYHFARLAWNLERGSLRHRRAFIT